MKELNKKILKILTRTNPTVADLTRTVYGEKSGRILKKNYQRVKYQTELMIADGLININEAGQLSLIHPVFYGILELLGTDDSSLRLEMGETMFIDRPLENRIDIIFLDEPESNGTKHSEEKAK